MMARYPALFFQEWPCQRVSLEEPVNLWADRDKLHYTIVNLLDYLNNNNSTTIHLLWADFGCGKTHTLRYIENLCLTKYSGIFALYSRMPENVKGFTEVYQAIVKSINFLQLFEMVRMIISTNGEEYLITKVLSGSDMFFNVFKSTLGSTESKAIAKRWLCGEKISNSDLKAIGAYSNLKTNEDDIQALECIVKIIVKSGKYSRFLLMIDEYQILHTKSDAVEKKLNSGLHKLYDSVSNNLSIILSFSFTKKKDVYLRLSGELQSREDPISISIPEMNHLEVISFVHALFKIFRTNEKPPSLTYPLKPEVLDIIIADIEKQHKKLVPREVIKWLAPVLESSRKKAESGNNPEITGKEAIQILSNFGISKD